jgi:hypothetical protein
MRKMNEGQAVSPIEIWAQRMQAAGLMPVLLPLLELARAFGPLASQVLLLGEPLLAGQMGQGPLRQMAGWLDDPAQVNRLLEETVTGGARE